MPATEPRRAIILGATAIATTTRDDAVPIAKGFAVTVNGLRVDGTPKFEAWADAGRRLAAAEKGSPLAIGDWYNLGEARWGEQFSQEIDPENGWSLKTLSNYSWIARRIALADRRMDRLGIKHHQLVAPLTPAKQRLWLTRAANDEGDEPWTAARLKKAIAEGEDLPVSSWYVIVACPSGQAQDELMARLEAEGLRCKASTRRARKAQEPEAPAA